MTQPESAGLIAPSPRIGRSATVGIKRPSERRRLSRSAVRALDVLEYFGATQRPLRAVDIARMLDIHASTADQLLKSMVDSAHLFFEAKSKTYLPTPRFIAFGNWVLKTYGPKDFLQDIVSEVQCNTGTFVTITTPNDLFMQILYLSVPKIHQLERGQRVAIFGSAIGSAYLAMLDGAEVEWLATRARTPSDQISAVLETIQYVREQGFSSGPTVHEKIWSIAMPLPSKVANVPMVLGLAGPIDATREGESSLLKIMRAAVGRWVPQ